MPDDEWHITSHYAEIRKKLRETDGESECTTSENWPSRVCSLPLRARTEFTPRPDPEATSITSILEPDQNGLFPHIAQPMEYTGPNVDNPLTSVPSGSVDVLAIVSNGRKYDAGRRLDVSPVEIGDNALAGYCDGTYNAECGRRGSCLLSGYQYSVGGVLFRSFNEWLNMTLPQIKDGLIMTRILLRRTVCATFRFDFAIDGHVTTWNNTEWNLRRNQDLLQTLLDDADFAKEPRDVDLAVRFGGCGDVQSMSLTHVYFA